MESRRALRSRAMYTALGSARAIVGSGVRCTGGCEVAQAARSAQRIMECRIESTATVECRIERTALVDNRLRGDETTLSRGGANPSYELSPRYEPTASCEPSNLIFGRATLARR